MWRVDRHKLDEWVERLENDTHEWALANPLTRSDRDAVEAGDSALE